MFARNILTRLEGNDEALYGTNIECKDTNFTHIHIVKRITFNTINKGTIYTFLLKYISCINLR